MNVFKLCDVDTLKDVALSGDVKEHMVALNLTDVGHASIRMHDSARAAVHLTNGGHASCAHPDDAW